MLNNMYPSGHCCCWCHTSSLVEVEFVSLWWRVEMNHSLLAAAGNVEPDVLIWFPVMKDICVASSAQQLRDESKVCVQTLPDQRYVVVSEITFRMIWLPSRHEGLYSVRWYTPSSVPTTVSSMKSLVLFLVCFDIMANRERDGLLSSCPSSV